MYFGELSEFMKYLILISESLLVVVLSIATYLLIRKTSFGKLKWIYQQIIIGVVFGGAAIFGTELGVNVGTSVANVRDAAPLVAGLIFGGPAGIIAATIGALERILYTLVFHDGYGYFSMLACVIATLLAGGYAWLLRKWFFENKTPNWLFGFATAAIMEVIHFIILYIGHITDPQEVLIIIKNIALPMILGNGFGVSMACLAVRLFEHFFDMKKDVVKKGSINNKVQLGLLILILVTGLMSTSFVMAIQNNNAYENADNALLFNASDLSSYIVDYSDKAASGIISNASKDYIESEGGTEALDRIKENNHITDLAIIALKDKGSQKAGDIIFSSDHSSIGRNIAEETTDVYEFVHHQMIEYSSFINYFHYSEYYDQKIKVAAMSLDPLGVKDYYLVTMINNDDIDAYFKETNNIDFDDQIRYFTSYRRVLFHGYIIVFDDEGKVVSDESSHYGSDINFKYEELQGKDPFSRYSATIYGIKSFYMYTNCETYTVVSVVPTTDVTDNRDMMIVVYTFMLTFVYASVFFASYILIRYIIIKNIRKINNTLSLIMAGDLDQKVNVKSSVEFMDLSNDINVTVDVLKDYIKEAEDRIDKELAFARTIQSSSLPSVFPPFPGIKSFDIYATMNTAKEVGGDFYDFYLIDGSHLAFLVADVSGKGIPASMFMMESKALLKNSSASLKDVEQVFNKVNESLCQGNDANMFVTCWMGIVDLKTGEVEFVNAGHNPPVIYKASTGKWEMVKESRDLVLAGLPTTRYHKQSIILEPGDKIYLYTDGVTEATNTQKELYGEERLIKYMNKTKTFDQYKLLNGIKKDIDKFVNGAEQFDDITMLVFDFKAKQK